MGEWRYSFTHSLPLYREKIVGQFYVLDTLPSLNSPHFLMN
jgi:hypothetical protein